MKGRDSRQKLLQRFETVLQRIKIRIMKNPNVLGIIVDGSIAREDQGPYSDIDVIALTKPKSKLKKLFYFDDGIQVDIWFMAIDNYSKKPTGDDVFYARGSSNIRILFDRNGDIKKLIEKRKRINPTSKDTQDMLTYSCRNLLEYAGKAKNGRLSKDDYLIRYAARMIAEASQNPIIICNNIRVISENTRWNQLISAKKKPLHFSIDYPICFGLVGTTDTLKVYNSAMRLAKESLIFVDKKLGKSITSSNIKSMLSYKLKSGIIE